MMLPRRVAVVVGVLLVLAGCEDASAEGDAGAGAYPPERLSDWGLFEDPAAQVPAPGVVPYEIISPLFSDYAAKHRFIRIPEGSRIEYTDEGDWGFPTGTVIVKTFGFLHDLREPAAGERLVETRLLVLEEDGKWHPYIYLWNEAMTDAVLTQVGARIGVEWTHTDGEHRTLEYRVPNAVQCANCHGGRDAPTPIGPRTAQMDRDFDYGDGPVNQIDHLASLGWFSEPPPPASERRRLVDPFAAGDLDARARSYLDANCAHCHSERGAAGQSGLWLGAEIVEQGRLGVCKVPVAAGETGGRRFDIVPGAPDESVMVFRMESDVPGIKMPELPSLLPHAEGVALVREWIAAMPPQACN